MRVHHLLAGRMCPPGLGHFDEQDGGCLVCHCLLLETNEGLVLVDSGMATGDLATPRSRLGAAFVALARPDRDPANTALAAIRRLGFSATDVTHIVLTHLDLDHAGGMWDFPNARTHVLMAEQEAAFLRTGWHERVRYRACHVDGWPRWSLHNVRGERWRGFAAVQPLPGLGDDVLLLPLPGHTRGHAAVAVNTGERWLVHAGDAYFHRSELQGMPAPVPLRWFQRANDMDPKLRIENRDRLVELAAGARDITVFCAHDPVEFRTLQAAGATS